jgi:hypothetical protein
MHRGNLVHDVVESYCSGSPSQAGSYGPLVSAKLSILVNSAMRRLACMEMQLKDLWSLATTQKLIAWWIKAV